MDNDDKHAELMKGVAKVVGDVIGTYELDNIGVHVYSSDESALQAGVINMGTREELIISLKRHDKRRVIYKKRVVKAKPTKTGRAPVGLELLTAAIDLGKEKEADGA